MEENIENNDSVSGSEEESRSDAIESTDKVLADSATETASPTAGAPPRHRRQEKIGLVTSDKMQKTVVVRVERQVKHRKYKRYIRRRTKFMAHDEVGAHTGDIVRIVETRPLSARKRWRVVEIVQKAR
jgi:small subunit ribosomal protein S17